MMEMLPLLVLLKGIDQFTGLASGIFLLVTNDNMTAYNNNSKKEHFIELSSLHDMLWVHIDAPRRKIFRRKTAHGRRMNTPPPP